MIAIFHLTFMKILFVFSENKLESVAGTSISMSTSMFDMIVIVQVVATISERNLRVAHPFVEESFSCLVIFMGSAV